MQKQVVFNRHIEPISLTEIHKGTAGLMKLDEILDQHFLFDLQKEITDLSSRGELIRATKANGGYGGHNSKLRVGSNTKGPGNYSSDITISDLPMTMALASAFAKEIYNPLMAEVIGPQFHQVAQIGSVVVYNQPSGGGGIPKHRDYGHADHTIEGYGLGVVGVVTVTGVGDFSLYEGKKIAQYRCIPGDISLMRAVMGEEKANPEHSVSTAGNVDRHTIVFRQVERD